MDNLIKNLPNRSFEKPTWSYIANVNLADPEYSTSRPIDLLLGADIYSIIMMDGIIRGQEATQPLAQQTQLGWLLCGGSVSTFRCNVILNNMDDLVSGSHTINEGCNKIAELNKVLSSEGFLRRKGSANNKSLLCNLNKAEQNTQAQFTFKTEETARTLGLRWDSEKDEFLFQCDTLKADVSKLTKRMLLSEISKTFDPMGWWAPLTTKMKLLFQKVWLKSDLQWSDPVPEDIREDWIKLKADLECLGQVKVPRWLQSKQSSIMELHGFCDASIKAYACVVYARIVTENRTSIVIIAAKSRLVPNKKEVTLPRLELCAADLLAKLMTKIVSSIDSIETKIFGWSDSMVALSWIQGNPDRWKPFVSNRVKRITASMPPELWHYVATKQNPADAASRGMTSSQLKENSLWWQGPEFLSKTDFQIERESKKFLTDLETRKQVNVIQKETETESIIDSLIERYSSFTKITRILAWILRAITPSKHKPISKYLTLHDLKKAKLAIIKHIQRTEFTAEIENIKTQKALSATSKILCLNPFLDQDNILRVGGRLKNANISEDMKYPIIIPYSGRLTELLIDQAHELSFHGGARLTLSLLRQKYWIVQGNRATKKRLRNCVTCKKREPKKLHQIMGNLPDYRTNPAPPFYHTGVDFTGFISVKCNKGRGIKTSKGYIALFICMVTKAVHIEVVSDLSSESFIAALRRMAARRSAPRHIYSDNATNFSKANRILQEEFEQLERVFSESFYKEISEMNIEWHWNCPTWASAGGIWERSIRSMKQLLKKGIGEQALTFEEYSTVLAQIEGALNSRPLCPISDDKNDIDFLTPAHFLTQRGDTAVIETAQDARTRWNLVNKTFKDIWKRWKSEYLTQLSVRSKWFKGQRNLEVGDVVTIHDDNMPAGKWPVGRVIEVHPGNDNKVRVVTLKTKNGLLKRPVVKLSLLPIEEGKVSKNEKQQSELKHKAKINEASVKKEATQNKGQSHLPKFVSVALSLIFFMSIVSSSEAAFSQKQLNNNQTLYFDSIAKLHLIRDSWKIVAYYEMAPYWQGNKAAKDYSDYLEQMCTRLKNSNNCQSILLQIRHDYNELQYYNQLLLNKQSDIRARTRRGLINAVGSVANSLFGVLDQSFAEKYERDIDLVHKDQNHLYQLWKNQTSVVEAEYNILKRTEQTIANQHKLMNRHMNRLENTTNIIQDELSLIQEITLAAIASNNLISNLRRIQETLIDTITDIFHGQINLHLLTPKQLHDELQLISSQVSRDVTLPIENLQNDLNNLYKLMKVKAKLTLEYFIFEITLPLISRDNFQIYRLIPIPHKVGIRMISVKPISEYVAINLKKDAYITVSKDDIKTCENKDETYLCELQQPIMHLAPEESFCEIEQSACQVTKNSCKDVWIPLNDRSTYLYFYCNTNRIRIICDDDVVSREVSKAGLISLTQQCLIKGRDVTIHSHQLFENTINMKTDLSQSISYHHLINTSIPIQQYRDLEEVDTSMNDSLKLLGEQIKSLKESAQQPDYLTSHDMYNYALSSGMLAISVIAFLWFLWRRGRRARTPLSEQHEQSERPRRDHEQRSQQQDICVSEILTSHADVSVSECKASVPKRWCSLRLKKQNSATSPIPKKRAVFTLQDSSV